MALVEDGNTISPKDYKVALQEQVNLSRKVETYFSDNGIDFLIHYSSNGSAPLSEPDVNQDINLLWTLTWLPVINIPKFLCPQGLPFGMQIIGPRYSDYRMFDFLQQLVNTRIAPELAPIVENQISAEGRR